MEERYTYKILKPFTLFLNANLTGLSVSRYGPKFLSAINLSSNLTRYKVFH